MLNFTIVLLVLKYHVFRTKLQLLTSVIESSILRVNLLPFGWTCRLADFACFGVIISLFIFFLLFGTKQPLIGHLPLVGNNFLIYHIFVLKVFFSHCYNFIYLLRPFTNFAHFFLTLISPTIK